jgi:hypothetical protein
MWAMQIGGTRIRMGFHRYVTGTLPLREGLERSEQAIGEHYFDLRSFREFLSIRSVSPNWRAFA